MKIGFDVSQTCVEKAGCGYYADSLARALAESFPEHEIILYHHFGNWHNESTEEGTHIDLPNVSEPLAHWSMKEAREFWTSPSIDPSPLGNPDIVVGNSFQIPEVPGAYHIFTVHDISIWTHPQFHTDANRLACQRGVLESIHNADAFAFVSSFSMDVFEDLFPHWLDRNNKQSQVTHLAPRGLRKEDTSTNLSERNFWLFVGSLEPRKNVEALLDAYEIYFKASKSPMALKLAGGTGWKSEKTKERIDKMAETMPINHLGYVSDEELETLYATAFGFIFPAWYEGFGLPVIEAMNQGTPVITSLESSLREIAEGHALGFDPASAEELSKHMLDLENDSTLWATLQEKSLARSDDFKWEKTAQSLSKLFETVNSKAPNN